MNRGLDPTLGAILPLIGVALGVLLGGIARIYLDRAGEHRREGADMRAATRLIDEDIDRMLETLNRMPPGGSEETARDLAPQPRSWETVRVTLARGLSEGQWDALRAAVYYVERAVPAIAGHTFDFVGGVSIRLGTSDLEDRCADAKTAARQAQEAIQRFRDHGHADAWYPSLRLPRGGDST